jgi:RNA polymerase sigma factor (TIGR02999 family)
LHIRSRFWEFWKRKPFPVFGRRELSFLGDAFFGMVGYPSGQRGQTVNLLAYAFTGSNPVPTTILIRVFTYQESSWPHTNFLMLGSREADQPQTPNDLLPQVYDELRRLARAKMAREKPGQTLQPTALVHEAWLRLGGNDKPGWKNRRHFFAAAAEAMRRILIERARRRQVLAKGGFAVKEEEFDSCILVTAPDDELLAIHDALDQLTAIDSEAAALVKLRYFSGLTMPESAEAMGLSLRNVERLWTFSRAWLRNALKS